MLTTEQRWGYTGTILCTTNGGVNWNLQSSGTTVILFCVSFTDANTETVVGATGTIVRTTNGGVNWNSQSSGLTSALNDVSFTDANNGTVVSETGGTILRTTNGGVNWNSQYCGTITNFLYAVSCADANNATVVGGGGTILRTGIPPLPAPTLVSPTNGAINLSPTIKFDWNSVPTATSYRIRVANDSLFTSIVKDSTVSIDSLVLSGFLANQLYYWKVAAINTAGTGLYSTVWNFRINPVGINNYSSIIPKEF